MGLGCVLVQLIRDVSRRFRLILSWIAWQDADEAEIALFAYWHALVP